MSELLWWKFFVSFSGSPEIEHKLPVSENKKKRKRINVGSDSEEDITEDVKRDVKEDIKKESKEDIKENVEEDVKENVKDVKEDLKKEVEKEIQNEPKKEIKTLSFLGMRTFIFRRKKLYVIMFLLSLMIYR